jgi:hypothetical protein
MALDTVQDYITRARTLILDEIEPYRYPTADLVEALNMAILETRRLRPELLRGYFRGPLPDFSVSDLSAQVPIDPQFRPAFVYYICGHAHLRDDEVTQDSRAAAFLNKFTAQMLTIQS